MSDVEKYSLYTGYPLLCVPHPTVSLPLETYLFSSLSPTSSKKYSFSRIIHPNVNCKRIFESSFNLLVASLFFEISHITSQIMLVYIFLLSRAEFCDRDKRIQSGQADDTKLYPQHRIVARKRSETYWPRPERREVTTAIPRQTRAVPGRGSSVHKKLLLFEYRCESAFVVDFTDQCELPRWRAQMYPRRRRRANVSIIHA